MLEKFSQQQLAHKSLAEIAEIKAKAVAAKVSLEKQKKANKDWSEAKQNELDEVVEFLVDLDDYLETRSNEEEPLEAESTDKYQVPAGTENHVHLSVARGRRFDQNTGKEITKPFTQIFTFAEWQLFKKNHKGLGYSIMAVLHDPYGEAKNFVVKTEEK